ncbi:cwc22p [Saccharomyces arboricola H-6]|uniref:Pre-mRNA-splicing factor CWC22 n=1 Tax=Saccharomyces arboricola (strain H-6 / AS 2.3317 / CBS 10644) TaxID=1160507 RepID=J8Q7S1_SACAR|nr:cwc22p [Saccharomyces arboricola H-6]
MSAAIDQDVDVDFQKENWQMLESHVSPIISNLTMDNLLESYKDLFQVNIILGENVVCKNVVEFILKKQNSRRIPALAALITLLNSNIPEIGETLTKELMLTFVKQFNHRDHILCGNVLQCLSVLFLYGVVHEVVILQILLLLLEKNSLQFVIEVLKICGWKLALVSRKTHDMIWEKLRYIFQTQDLPRKLCESLEELFEIRQKDYKNESQTLLVLNPADYTVHTHSYIVNDEDETNDKLGDFEECTRFDELTAVFNTLQQKLLINDQFNADEGKTNQLQIKDMTSANDVEFKKKIYLILKSSLTGDEAAHKLLKMKIANNLKGNVADIIIKSSIQESTFSKYYSILSERMITFHRSWQIAYNETFEQNYTQDIEDFETDQLRILGKFWGHLISYEFLPMGCLTIIKLTEEDSCPQGRIFIKFLFQELVNELGLDELQTRLSSNKLEGMFPLEGDADHIRYSINFFTAIGLGLLTEEMRSQLTIVQEIEDAKEEEQKLKRDEELEKLIKRSRESQPSQGPKIHESRLFLQGDVKKRSRSRSPSSATSRRRARSKTPPKGPRDHRNRSRTPPARRQRQR